MKKGTRAPARRRAPSSLPDEMSPQGMLLLAVERGHHRRPQTPETWNVKRTDVESGKITPKHRLGKAIIANYQLFHSDQLDALVAPLYGGRLSEPDGEIGEGTKSLFNSPRCAMPDYQVPDDAELASKWNSQDEAAGVAYANWPKGCRGSLKFNYLFDSLPGVTAEETESAFIAMTSIWTMVIDDLKIRLHREISEPARLDGYANKGRLPGSVLAWSKLAVSRCDVSLDQMYDTTINWRLSQLIATIVHEVGHLLGLNHNGTSGSTMFPQITNTLISRFGWPWPVDLRQCRNLGYEVANLEPARPPIEQLYVPWWGDDPVDPPPLPPPSGKQMRWIDGKLYNVTEAGVNPPPIPF